MYEKAGLMIGSLMFFIVTLITVLRTYFHFKDMIKNIVIKFRKENSKLMPCYACGYSISKTATFCPRCGHRYGEINTLSNSIFGNLVIGVVCACLSAVGAYILLELVLETYRVFTH